MAERAPLSTLSSLLASHGVPMRAIEDAIARQVVHGSDLATNLLEVGGVGEEQLLAALAQASELEPAQLGSLPTPSPSALAVIPVDLAQRENIYPISLAQGLLTLAVAEPFVSVDGLLFTQPVRVEQIIAPLARIRQAISKAYRVPLDRRFTRLLGKLGEPTPTKVANAKPKFEIEDEPTMISAAPLVPSRPATQSPATLVAGTNPTAAPTLSPAQLQQTPPGPPVVLVPPEPARPPVAEPAPNAKPKSSTDFVGAPTIPQPSPESLTLPRSNPLVWAAKAPVVQVVEPAQPWRPLSSDDMPETVPAPRLAAMAAAKADKEKPANEEDAAPVSRRTAALRAQTARGRAAGGFFRRTVVGEHKAREQVPQPEVELPTHERKGSVRVRRKGPFPAQQAEEELTEATTTDGVLEIFFAFSHQFFEYSVLFVVSGDVADGRDACGPGLTSSRVKNIKVPLDQPSMLQLARDRKAPVAIAPIAHGLDAQIVRELDREGRFEEGNRASMAVIPIVVRNRVVALLLGDDGPIDVELSALGDVIIIAGRTVEALERIILRKKLGAAGRSPSVAPPPGASEPPPPDFREGLRPVGLAALARALDNSSVDSESSMSSGENAVSLPPTKAAPTATMLSAAAVRSSETPDAHVVRHDQPNVLPRSVRQTGRSSSTNRAVDAPSSSGDSNPDGEVPEPPAASERSGPGSRRRRFLTGPASRPRIAPMAFSEGGVDSSEQGQPTIQGVPRSQRRGVLSGRSRTLVAPRPLPPNLQGRSGAAVRVPPARSAPVDSSPMTIAGPPQPPTMQARRLGLSNTNDGDKQDAAAQQAERETVALLRRFVESNGVDDDAGQALLQLGERAVPAIMVRFPGPLAHSISADMTDLPPASSCGPLFALLVAIGSDAVLALAQRATSILSEDRFWAAHVLGEIACIESAEIVATMLFDDDLSVRRIARKSSVMLMGSVHDAAATIAPMLEQAARGSDRPGRRFIAIETLGELAISSTIPTLIAMLGEPVQDVGDAVHRALVQITCHDFGRDTRRWIDWFAANAQRHRIEWIIDTLLNESVELRRIAVEALAPVIGRDLGYDAEGSRDERAAAHVRYLLWWEQEGRVQYGQA